MTKAATAAAALALVLAGAARAEMPSNHGAPEVTGRAAVGWGVVGHNGAWLYLDGSACGPECVYDFTWQRCDAWDCRSISGATNRVYKVRGVDVGYRLRVVVTATKYDCGEWNYAAGTQECRYVSRSAESPLTDVVAAPKAKPTPKPKPVKPKSKPAKPKPTNRHP
jgi:hypothetical protein